MEEGGGRFYSWYVVSIDTGHRAQSPQSSPRWSPAFKMEPVLSVSSFTLALLLADIVVSTRSNNKTLTTSGPNEEVPKDNE